MNHSEVHSRMAEYLEGELALRKRALFDAHIDRCAACRSEFTELRETIALVRALPDPEPPPFLVETVMRRLRDGEGQRSVMDRVRDGFATLVAPRVAVPATALLVGLLMASGNLDTTRLDLPLLRQTSPTASLRGEPARAAELARGQGAASHGDAASAGEALRVVVQRERALATHTPSPERPGLSLSVPASATVTARSPGPPPVVSRAPRITIQIPIRGVAQLAKNWPALSTPGRGVPFAQATPPLERNASGVMQARASGIGTRGSDFSVSPGETERSHRKRELEARLDRLVRNPTVYSIEFAGLNVTEQEIWLEALAEYATEVSRGDDAVRRLRQAADPRAQALATALATQLRLAEAEHRREMASVAGER